MKSKLISFEMLTAFLLMAFFAGYGLAADAPLSPGSFLDQVLAAVQNLGGLPWVLKISAVVALVISSMKVSLFNELLWSKLGPFKVWLAPILGLLAGVTALPLTGVEITLPNVLAYITAGAGAVIFHELLDTLKAVPGLGPVYIGLIDLIERFLGGPKALEKKQ